MDGIRATPYQYPLIGSVNQLIGGLLGYMRDPRRTQQMQGLAGLLESTGIPKTVERLAYGEPLTNIQRANVPLLRPETAEALLTVAPVPPVAGRAAMAAGRAGERMAERVVPQIMERGGMPAGLLESMSSRTVSPLTVYHGSPAKFERFDPTKIGSGEGAQAYGYGHYVAESPEVARGYQESLSGGAMKMLRSTFSDDPELWVAGQIYSKISKPDIKEGLQLLGYKGNTDELIKSAENRMKNELHAGSFYEIDLPDEQIARMIDWDKPLSEQPKFVQDALVKSGLVDFEKNIGLSPSGELRDLGWSKNVGSLRGEELYRRLIEKQFSPERGATTEARKMSEAEAAEILRQAGIPGIRYLDQGSRGTGEGTSNFVVFPGGEDLLTILKRNGGLLGP